MERSRPSQRSPPHVNGLAHASRQRYLEAPTVKQALPYAPFSSIVPFNPDLIPVPLALPVPVATAFERSEGVQNARRELDRLTAGAQRAENASKRCQQTLDDVRRLLDAESITQFKFNTRKRTKEDTSQSAVKPPALSAFARMVFDNTDISYRYLTPVSQPQSSDPEDNIVVSASKKISKQEPAAKSAPIETSLPRKDPAAAYRALPQPRPAQVQIDPEPSSFAQNYSSVTSSTQTGSTSAGNVPFQSTRTAFVLPATLTPAQLTEYQRLKVLEETSKSRGSPSRNQSIYIANGVRAASTDQHYKANKVQTDLQELLNAIFTAEDKLASDTSGDVSVDANEYFVAQSGDEGAGPVLLPDAQMALDLALQKVIVHGRLENIDVEQLARVSRFCESAIAAVHGSLHIGDEWADQELHDWQARISTAQSSLIAARTLMRIMTGGSHHRELQSEDYVRAILDTIRNVVEGCLIPIAEERPFLGERLRSEKNIPRNPKFDIAVEHRKPLQGLIGLMRKAFKLLGDLLAKTSIDESGISSIEYFCKALIFAENGATDKDSALGVKSFEDLRVSAMDVLARVFTKYTSQRNFIFDEILYSLEKLPATKQSARQFQPIGTKPIQLVSALLMRLVQTSATSSATVLQIEDEEQERQPVAGDDEEDSDHSAEDFKVSSGKQGGYTMKIAKEPRSLPSVYQPLRQDAQKHAKYIVSILIARALTTSKSSTDEPFRKLLDIFTDDFLNVLGSSDWPAAELLLRVLVSQMVAIAENGKSPAPSRTLALELLGTIGSGILDIHSSTISAAKGLDTDDKVSELLINLVKHIENGELMPAALTSSDGAYRIVIEDLHSRGLQNDLQLQTARGYHLVQWAELVCGSNEASADSDVVSSISRKTADLQHEIRHMIEDAQWLEENTQFLTPSSGQGKLAGKIVASTSLLSRAFVRILNTVLSSMSSEQPTVRSRALKSVTILLEKDPSVLDRTQVLNQIMRCLSDSSPLVRDSALTLVQKCVFLRPALDLKVYDRVINRTTDNNAPVRKRAMAFLKQIYLRNDDNKVRAAISEALISRIKDSEESVAEVALTTIEEVWFSAFRNVKLEGDRQVDAMIGLRSHAGLIIQTILLGNDVAQTIGDLIKTVLTKSKQASENMRACKLFVHVLSEGIIDPGGISGAPSQKDVLEAAEVFAKSAPKLFTATQLERLEPYTQNLNNSDDLQVYQRVITILRYTMPVLAGIRQEFVKNLQEAMVPAIGKLPKSELKVAAPCLWTIATMLGSSERLFRLVTSALNQVYDHRHKDLTQNPTVADRLGRLFPIIAQFGKVCNFDQHVKALTSTDRYSWYKGKSVAGLLVEISCSYTSPRQPLNIRKASLEVVCEVCQSYSEHFLRADVTNAIQQVFTDQISSLEEVLLESLESFFASGDINAEEQEILGTGVDSGTQRLGGTYQATGYDTASASLSQRFLQQFLRIALSSVDDVALSAARIVAQINERGMAHPGDSGPSLVALETCPNPVIAKLAFLAHKEQFTKHENVFEKGFVKAVQQAFEYQQRVAQSTVGCTGSPPTAKLHFFWEILKGGKPKARSKFFTNICSTLDFDPAKLNLSDAVPQHLLFVRFCVENLAFLEYDRLDELVHLLQCLEKTFAGTGTSVAQAVESEVLKLQVPINSTVPATSDLRTTAVANTTPGTSVDAVDPHRLEQLAVSSQILSLMWETRSYLRRVWNIQKHSGKHKMANAKDVRAPARASNASALTETYLRQIESVMTPASTGETQRGKCMVFVELFSVDNEVKIGSEDEDNTDLQDGDDARSEGSSARSSSAGPISRGKKRKPADACTGSSKKRNRVRRLSLTKAVMDEDENGDWI